MVYKCLERRLGQEGYKKMEKVSPMIPIELGAVTWICTFFTRNLRSYTTFCPNTGLHLIIDKRR